MAYTPDPTDVTAPQTSEKASSAPEEFRALKVYLKDVILPLIDTKLAKAGGTISGDLTVAGEYKGLKASQITTALGFTPYNASNPAGYISGINQSMVIAAIGYIPMQNSRGAVDSVYGFNIGTNARGNKTVSASPPSGGGDGDIWYQYIP